MSQDAIADTLEQRYQPISSSPRLTLRWALQRAVLGIVILVVSIGGIAFLLDASIEKNAENADIVPARQTAPDLAPSTQPFAATQATVRKTSAVTAVSK